MIKKIKNQKRFEKIQNLELILNPKKVSKTFTKNFIKKTNWTIMSESEKVYIFFCHPFDI